MTTTETKAAFMAMDQDMYEQLADLVEVTDLTDREAAWRVLLENPEALSVAARVLRNSGPAETPAATAERPQAERAAQEPPPAPEKPAVEELQPAPAKKPAPFGSRTDEELAEVIYGK